MPAECWSLSGQFGACNRFHCDYWNYRWDPEAPHSHCSSGRVTTTNCLSREHSGTKIKLSSSAKFILSCILLTIQTFGVLTSRVDIVESSGLTPARQSASTQSQSNSASSSLGSVIKGPVSTRDSSVGGGGAEIGQEIEVFNLLIVDQHSFAG